MAPHYVRGQLCHRRECSKSPIEKLMSDNVVGATRWRPNYDRIVADRPSWSSTTSPLFTLPLELLEGIVQFLSSKSLSNLAITSKDCHALARPFQFTTAYVDLAEEKLSNLRAEEDELLWGGLLSHLSLEVGSEAKLLTHPIAPYIRCLSFTAGFGSGRRRTLVPEDLYTLIPQLVSLRSLHHDGMTEPGGGKTEMTPKYLLALSNSTVERLHLERFTYRSDLDYPQLQSFLAKPWGLQALVLNMIDHYHWAEASRDIFWHIMDICGHLKHLSTDVYPQLNCNPDSDFDEFSESTYPFLQTLHLAGTMISDDYAYYPPMKSLTALDVDGPSGWSDHLMTQSLPTVSSFAVQVDDPVLVLDFLTKNPQLKILSLQSDISPRVNDCWKPFTHRLPLSLRQLSGLEALKLDLEDDEITETIILALSSIVTLKRMSLGYHRCSSAGSSEPKPWPEKMCFQSLEYLELEISSYNYKTEMPQRQQVPSSNGTLHEQASDLQYALQQANSWAHHQPNLKWIALEGLAFSFDKERQVRCLNHSEAKDDYFNELEDTFTMARPWI